MGETKDMTPLDLWTERLDYYINRGSTMTLNAEQTLDLQTLIQSQRIVLSSYASMLDLAYGALQRLTQATLPEAEEDDDRSLTIFSIEELKRARAQAEQVIGVLEGR